MQQFSLKKNASRKENQSALYARSSGTSIFRGPWASARIFIFFFLFRCVQDVGRAVGMFLFYNTTAAKQFQNK